MNLDTLPVSEIFYSIDGEGCRTGAPTVFIRLFGCNLNCRYCDSRYACKSDSGLFMNLTIEDIVAAVQEYEPCKCVTLTGGEPLIHSKASKLVAALRELGYWVNIETNGSIDLFEFIKAQEGMCGPKKCAMDYFFTMDWKSVSSGEADKMLERNLAVLSTNDVLKFVVGTHVDLDQMKIVLDSHPDLAAQIYVSPVWGEMTAAHIVDYIKEMKLVYVRVQLQLHKIIWNPNKRGV